MTDKKKRIAEYLQNGDDSLQNPNTSKIPSSHLKVGDLPIPPTNKETGCSLDNPSCANVENCATMNPGCPISGFQPDPNNCTPPSNEDCAITIPNGVCGEIGPKP